jgi:VWFA-related protein
MKIQTNITRAVRSRFLMVGPVLIVAALLQASAAQSQKSKEPNAQDEAITLKAHLVTLDVMVKDNKGKFLTDLTADDFTVLENGVKQKVEFFDPPLGAGPAANSGRAPEAKATVNTGGGPSNIISLVLDGVTTDLTNLTQVREGTLRYIRERISEADTVALFGVSTDLRLLQPFTRDKAKLIAAVEKAYLPTAINKNLDQAQLAEDIEKARAAAGDSTGTSFAATPEAASQGRAASEAMMAARVLEQYLQLRSQLSAQQARPVLAALAAICKALRTIPGKKTVVLFSQGFVAPTILDWQVQSVVDIANRANVAIYIIDSAGLRTSGPLSTAPVPASPLSGVAATGTTESRMKTVGGESMFDTVRNEGLNREYDILYRISGDTGGEFIKGTNDLSKGLDRIDEEIRSRYTLAYYSSDPNFDGSFRKLKVEVARPDTKVSARSGYYATAGDDIVLLSPEDKKLLASLPSIEAEPGLPFFVQLSPFRFKEGRYVVPIAIEVPPSAVQFNRKGDKRNVQFEVLGVIREGEDKVISRLGGAFSIDLSSEQYQAILKNNIFFRQDMELVPGAYKIDLLFRDKLSGKMAGKRESLSLPTVTTEFSTSEIVLSRHALQIKSANGSTDSGDVLTEGTVQIRPLPSRQFHTKDNLIIFFDVYDPAVNAEMGKPLVRVTVTVMKDDKPASKPIDYVLTETVAQPVPHLTFAKFLSLDGFAPGDYTALIDTTDTVTHKHLIKRVAFAVNP